MESNNGIQIWTVPKTGDYRIKAAGANGGGYAGGSGMIVEIITKLNMGEKIKILVGQHGSGFLKAFAYNDGSGNGGGGSFVVNSDNTAILVAGGGGGSQRRTGSRFTAQIHGLVGTSGGYHTNYIDVSSGVSNGEGGRGGRVFAILSGSGGGGGLNGNGGGGEYGGSTDYPADAGGYSFINGGVGGSSFKYYDNMYAGFGGGGGFNGVGSGGGGGYSGGDAGPENGDPGGGGGSYGIRSFTASGSLNYGDGYVTITKIET